MSEQDTKQPVRNLERVGEAMNFPDYERADKRREAMRATPGIAKFKIFRRKNETFDLVAYKKIGEKPQTAGQKVVKALQEAVEAEQKPVHGLKSKDRKKSPKKAQ